MHMRRTYPHDVEAPLCLRRSLQRAASVEGAAALGGAGTGGGRGGGGRAAAGAGRAGAVGDTGRGATRGAGMGAGTGPGAGASASAGAGAGAAAMKDPSACPMGCTLVMVERQMGQRFPLARSSAAHAAHSTACPHDSRTSLLPKHMMHSTMVSLGGLYVTTGSVVLEPTKRTPKLPPGWCVVPTRHLRMYLSSLPE